MLYPKHSVNRKENNLLERLELIKESFIIFINAFRSYNSFILFIKQKFHF